MRLVAMTICLLWLLALPAQAEQTYPDLKGTWIGSDTGAFVTALQFGTKAVPETEKISCWSISRTASI